MPKPGTDEFTLPLFFAGMSQKFESVLLSLFTDRVTKQTLPGFDAVQFSGAFMRTNMKASELTQFNKLKACVMFSGLKNLLEIILMKTVM